MKIQRNRRLSLIILGLSIIALSGCKGVAGLGRDITAVAEGVQAGMTKE